MALRKASEQVREWLGERGITLVTETILAELTQAFPKLRSLRKAVRDSGVALVPIVEGVRQDSFENLARTLVALQHEYEANRDERIRAMVIQSKAHARLASLKRPEKREMVEWMLVWLNDPSLFETWVRLLASHRARPNTEQTDED